MRAAVGAICFAVQPFLLGHIQKIFVIALLHDQFELSELPVTSLTVLVIQYSCQVGVYGPCLFLFPSLEKRGKK